MHTTPRENALTTVELTDGRLILRPWRAADAAGLFEAARESVASVGPWLSWCHDNYKPQDAAAWIAQCTACWRAGTGYALPIFDAGGELLGATGINRLDLTHHRANLGHWVRESRQGQGIAAAAVRLAAGFGFADLALRRLEIVVQPGNRSSRRVAERAGARFEGIAPDRLSIDGRLRDAAVYALTPGALAQFGEAQRRATSS